MKLINVTGVLGLLLAVTTHADTVQINNQPYKIVETMKLDRSEEDFKRFEQKIVGAYYGPTYMTIFETETAQEHASGLTKSEVDGHQRAFAAQSAVLGAGLAKGFSVTGMDITNLAVSFLFSGVEDQAVRLVVSDAYEATVNGSVTVTKWYPGQDVTTALADGYGELADLLVQDCNFKIYSEGKMWRGRKHFARITGKCQTNKARPAVVARNSDAFQQWEEGAGQGSIVMYTFPAMGRSQEEMRAFGAIVRKTLSKDWYVMQAETLTNQQTGQPEKMYLISKDGVMKAYPLPPAPVFK